jgi:aspartate/methionine/tyrosine aminotransferase
MVPASSSATGPSGYRATWSDGADRTAAALDFGAMRPSRISAKAERFTESVIREMNRLAVAHGAVSLAQGFPDFACPPELKRAVADAVDADINQYAITWGSKPLRDAIAETTPRHFPGWGAIDPETQITVTCGATEAMIAAMLGLLDPGDEVIVFEPYYENYGPDAILSDATPRYVTLHEPDWSIDPDELRRAFNGKTRGIVVNSPHNPTGKVFSRGELELIAGLCREFDVIAFTDDIYEHLVFEGEHIPLATLPGMAERTVSIHSMSKTYSVTGWRVGWTIAPADLSIGIRRVHDFLTVGAAAPLQAAAVTALAFPPEYYEALVAGYRERRDILVPALEAAGFRVHRPAGAYYVMTDIRDLTEEDDVAFALRLIRDPGVAAVPGSSFFSRPELGRTKLRFAFPKRRETLEAAAERLASLRTASSSRPASRP